MHWASSEQAWMNVDAEELFIQGDSDKTAWLSNQPPARKAMRLQMHRGPSTGAWRRVGHNHTLTFVPCLMSSWVLVGNFKDKCLLGGTCFSSIGSPLRFLLCYSKGLFMTTEDFTLWEMCSFCFCLHRMFLSAPREGTGNYRAIHLHPHNFRQIL